MKLPNRKIAIVESKKLNDYLLSKSHPVGRSKAKLFHAFGFSFDNSDLLKSELLSIAVNQEIAEIVEGQFGKKYIIDGKIHCPFGKQLQVRTIWIMEEENSAPRFVTAYPV